MRIARSLGGVVLLGIAPWLHAETMSYPAAFAQATEITLNTPVGNALVRLPESVGSAYVAAANRRAWRTETRVSNADDLLLDPTPDNAYDNVGAPRTFVTYSLSDTQGTRQSWFAAVEARHGGGTRVQLLVGIDANGDGLPQASEEVCRIGDDPYDQQRCLLDLRGKTDHALWAFAHIIGHYDIGVSPSERVSVSIATADFQLSNGGTKVSVAPSSDLQFAPAAIFTNDVLMNFSYRQQAADVGADPFEGVGGLLLTAADESSATAMAWPLRVEFTAVAQTSKVYAMAPRYDSFEEVKVFLQPNEAYDGFYVDNPGQDLLEVVVSRHDATVLVWSETFPLASVDSRVRPAAPPANAREIHFSPSAASTEAQVGRVCEGCADDVPIAHRRVHFSVRNTVNGPIGLRMRVRMARGVDFATRQLPGLTAPSGNYYNPLRSGDGIFLDRYQQLQIFYWYTFDQNGEPVWYTAAAEPSYERGAVGTFNTTLYRIRQVSAFERQATPIGRIVLTAAGNDGRELMFNWSIDGDAGSNRIQLAAVPRCSQQSVDVDYNVTGHWFSLEDPGWGTNLLGLRNDIAEGLYLFDAAGDPRWVFGGLVANHNAWTGALYQFHGACPTCFYSAPQLMPVGNANLIFSGDGQARASYIVNFAAPLRGSFRRTMVALDRVTDAVNCNMQ